MLTKAVGIVYCLWGLLFSGHCHADKSGVPRNIWTDSLWELVHFPLQIGIALLLATLGVRTGGGVQNH